MKYIFLFTVITALLMAGCQQSEDPEIYQDTGTVINYAGAEYCSIIIELDNGDKIQPLHYPYGFVFVQGQRVLVKYMKLPNIISTCGKGAASEIVQVEEITCGSPVIEISLQDSGNLPDDPFMVQEAAVEGDCLLVKVVFSGGCRNHDFSLIKSGEAGQDEATAVVELRHDANDDVCEAALSKELSFNLASLKEDGFSKILVKAPFGNEETESAVFDLMP